MSDIFHKHLFLLLLAFAQRFKYFDGRILKLLEPLIAAAVAQGAVLPALDEEESVQAVFATSLEQNDQIK